MKAQSFLYVLAFCTRVLNVGQTKRVNQMNQLLSFPGWRELVNVEIVQNERRHSVNDLLSTDQNGQMVTKENMQQKTEQVHHFLSCEYGNLLMMYCYYGQSIGDQCMRKVSSSETSVCLRKLIQIIKHSGSLVSRMQSALTFVARLASLQIVVNNRNVSAIFNDFKDYVDGKTFDRNALNMFEEIRSVQDGLAVTKDRLVVFSETFCWPTTFAQEIRMDQMNETSSSYSWAAFVFPDLTKEGERQEDADISLNQKLRRMTNEFALSKYTCLGFAYDPVFGNTGLLHSADPNQLTNKMNELLANPEWSNLFGQLVVIGSDRRHYTVNDLLSSGASEQKVTNDNVDRKIEQAHRLLSCDFARLFKTCVDYYRDALLQCRRSGNYLKILSCLDSFFHMIKESVPLVLQMQDALSNFYQMSPRTFYDKEVSKILNDFKNYFEIKIFFKWTFVNLSNITVESLAIEQLLSIKRQRLLEFFNTHCWPTLQKEKMPVNDAKLAVSQITRIISSLWDYLKYQIAYIEENLVRKIEDFDINLINYTNA